jgi:hypothetical protein
MPVAAGHHAGEHLVCLDHIGAGVRRLLKGETVGLLRHHVVVIDD